MPLKAHLGKLNPLVLALPAVITVANLSAGSLRYLGVTLLLPSLVALVTVSVLLEPWGVVTLRRWTRRASSPLVITAVLFGLFWMTFGLIGGRSPDVWGFVYRVASCLVAFVAYRVLALRSASDHRTVLLGFVIGGVILTVSGSTSYVLLLLQGAASGIRAAGSFGNANIFAYTLVFSYAASLMLGQERVAEHDGEGPSWLNSSLLLSMVQVVLVAGVVLSFSRGGLLTLVVMAGWYAIRRRRIPWLLLVIGLAIGTLVVFVVYDPFNLEWVKTMDPGRIVQVAAAGSDRLEVAGNGLAVFAEHPLTGDGYGATYHRAQWRLGTGTYSHNQIIELLATGGAVTILPFLALCLVLFGRALVPGKGYNPATFLLWLLAVSWFSHYILLQPYTWIGLAVCIGNE